MTEAEIAAKKDAELDALRKFKAWVHAYLDGKGIPFHPPGTHGAAGCRIGDRMDFVFAELERLRVDYEAASEFIRLNPTSLAAQLKAQRERAEKAEAERDRLLAAIRDHHDQRADDRCIGDDTRLYAAAGLPPADHRVGDKAAMLENCARYIERRCTGGGWPTYREVEAERDAVRTLVTRLVAKMTEMNELWRHDFGNDVETDALIAEARAAGIAPEARS